MRHEKPLLFITSPIIRKYRYTPIVEEESTSVFELEHSRMLDPSSPAPELPAVQESLEGLEPSEPQKEAPIIGPFKKILEYLYHPFRKELYTPIEIITGNGKFKGQLHDLGEEIVWINIGEEITSIRIEEILDVLWKQQSFTI